MGKRLARVFAVGIAGPEKGFKTELRENSEADGVFP